jgi:hypothetical protein
MINLGSQGCAVRDESGRVLCPSHPIPRLGTRRRRSGGRAASGAVVRKSTCHCKTMAAACIVNSGTWSSEKRQIKGCYPH